MAKSKLIKDIISDSSTLVQAFERLLVIAMELEDENLQKWVKQEINGYGEDDDLPDYRIVSMQIIGDYQIIGGGYLQTRRNQVLPTLGLNEKFKKSLDCTKISDSISGLLEALSLIKKGKRVGRPIPPEMFSLFEKGTNICVTSATAICSEFSYYNILQCTKTRLIEVLTLLEKNFGNLDEIDIDSRNYDDKEVDALKGAVAQIINGNQVTNTYYISSSKIKNSNIGEENKNEKAVTTELSYQSENKNKSKSKIGSILKKIFKARG